MATVRTRVVIAFAIAVTAFMSGFGFTWWMDKNRRAEGERIVQTAEPQRVEPDRGRRVEPEPVTPKPMFPALQPQKVVDPPLTKEPLSPAWLPQPGETCYVSIPDEMVIFVTEGDKRVPRYLLARNTFALAELQKFAKARDPYGMYSLRKAERVVTAKEQRIRAKVIEVRRDGLVEIRPSYQDVENFETCLAVADWLSEFK